MHMKVKSESTKKSNGNSSDAVNAHGDGGEIESIGGNNNIEREQMISEAAYFNAERRGFAPGNQIDDWLQAEAEVTSQFASLI
jgi:hypothetical protein